MAGVSGSLSDAQKPAIYNRLAVIGHVPTRSPACCLAAWSIERRAQLQAHLRRLGNTPAVTVHGMGDAEGIMSVLNTAVVNVAIGKPASALDRIDGESEAPHFFF